MWKDFIPQDFHKDLNSSQNTTAKSSKWLKEIKYDQYFLYISGKASMDIFKGSIF